MMNNRDFSDSVKLNVIKANLEKNRGEICCAICGTKLLSIKECHFDHITPFAKGGKSVAENCQILCVNCNLKKNDKEMQDFILEEKARLFLLGEEPASSAPLPAQEDALLPAGHMTKALFDEQVRSFIDRKGDIHKVDFSRAYNNLPSIHYVRKYYGDLNTMKAAFGVTDLSSTWNRETIRAALENYVAEHGDILQKDMVKKNRLPSLPCVLTYYPEYENFTDVKRGLCGLDVPEKWTVENALQAGKDYVAANGKLTQSKLGKYNHLPSANVVNNLFGSLAAYQQAVGAEVTAKNEWIAEEDIEKAVDARFEGKERVVETMNRFFASFPYSPSTIQKRYGTFAAFCEEYGIIVLNARKARYTKQEVDEAIAKWVKAGHGIPIAKDLTKNGLPSMSVILKYYEDWKAPFILYRRLYDKLS